MIQFHIMSSPHTPLVLGQPWLKLQNPHMDWSENQVRSWSSFCHSSCLRSAIPPAEVGIPPVQQEPLNLSAVPPVYHSLREVFSKQRALSLPPHRPYDCTIDLLPGASLPSSRLFNLSRTEREAMETYIKDSLAAGIISIYITLHPPSEQASSLYPRRTAPYVPAFTTEALTTSPSRTSIHCPSSIQPSNPYRRPPWIS